MVQVRLIVRRGWGLAWNRGAPVHPKLLVFQHQPDWWTGKFRR